jgi:hypothetical protein
MHTKLRAVALAATLALTAGGLTTAQAHHSKPVGSATKLTGGETSVSLNDATKSALSSAGITAAPIAPANGTFTFPIAGGKVKASSVFGFVALKGGVKLTKGDKTARLGRLVVATGPRGGGVFAFARKHAVKRGFRFRGHKRARAAHHGGRRFGGRVHWVRVLALSNVERADANGKVVITADAALTKRAAKLLNAKFDTTTFSAGQAVGTLTVSATG